MNTYITQEQDFVVTVGNIPREYILKIKDLPTDQKPREKLIKLGPSSLTANELMAVVLNTGTKKEGVLGMADRIIKEYGEKSIISQLNPTKLSEDLDIPIVKACQIVACGELGRRFYQKNSGVSVLRNAKDVFEYLIDMRNLPKEHMRGIYLNTHNRVIHDEVISIGTINTNIIHPREVFRPAIQYGAAAIILAHNHPSGNSEPSHMDIEITKQLIEAGKIIGISILDHVVITKNKFTSINANYNH
jgi:DNA repair protein RadC